MFSSPQNTSQMPGWYWPDSFPHSLPLLYRGLSISCQKAIKLTQITSTSKAKRERQIPDCVGKIRDVWQPCNRKILVPDILLLIYVHIVFFP